MTTTLHLTYAEYIFELQREFSLAFPFLRLDLFRLYDESSILVGKPLPGSALLKAAGLQTEGTVEISDEMTVAQLESLMRDKFGLIAQVARQSGNIWLETTITDSWTLDRQNEHGREISGGMPVHKDPEDDFDLGRGDLQ